MHSGLRITAAAAAAAPPPTCRRFPPPSSFPRSDVALIEFIRALNDKQPVADKFIIEGALGDQHLLIRVG